MSTPPKPWENANGDANFNRLPPINEFIGSQFGSQEVLAAPPPPLPPRSRSTAYGSYGSAGGPMNMYYGSGGLYGSGSYMSPYGGAGPFGASPYGYSSSFPFRNVLDPRQGGVDDGSPFQGIESIVRAISSLSMMLESTYQSMYMSLRAVLGVADNMERLRSVFVELFGGLAVFRTFIWFAKKILYILGLIKDNPARESVWQAAAAQVSGTGGGPQVNRGNKAWPIVAFFGLMCGGPFLLSRFMTPSVSSPSSWNPNQAGDSVRCVAKYDFETNQRGELPFRRGELLIRQKSAQGGWALAANRNGRIGLVPADRLKPITHLTANSKPAPQFRVAARPSSASTSQQNFVANQRPDAQPRGSVPMGDGDACVANDMAPSKSDRIFTTNEKPAVRPSNENIKGSDTDCEK